ncbi:hypothetical protein YB2330_001769 [Saitoella coloradoensis]
MAVESEVLPPFFNNDMDCAGYAHEVFETLNWEQHHLSASTKDNCPDLDMWLGTSVNPIEISEDNDNADTTDIDNAELRQRSRKGKFLTDPTDITTLVANPLAITRIWAPPDKISNDRPKERTETKNLSAAETSQRDERVDRFEDALPFIFALAWLRFKYENLDDEALEEAREAAKDERVPVEWQEVAYLKGKVLSYYAWRYESGLPDGWYDAMVRESEQYSQNTRHKLSSDNYAGYQYYKAMYELSVLEEQLKEVIQKNGELDDERAIELANAIMKRTDLDYHLRRTIYLRRWILFYTHTDLEEFNYGYGDHPFKIVDGRPVCSCYTDQGNDVDMEEAQQEQQHEDEQGPEEEEGGQEDGQAQGEEDADLMISHPALCFALFAEANEHEPLTPESMS